MDKQQLFNQIIERLERDVFRDGIQENLKLILWAIFSNGYACGYQRAVLEVNEFTQNQYKINVIEMEDEMQKL